MKEEMAMANNEERKNRELNEEELEGVTGGTGANGDGTFSFNAGDCFQMGMNKFKVLATYTNISGDDAVSCRVFDGYNAYSMSYYAKSLCFTSEKFRGNNAEGFDY